jgi:hypothetical protein
MDATVAGGQHGCMWRENIILRMRGDEIAKAKLAAGPCPSHSSHRSVVVLNVKLVGRVRFFCSPYTDHLRDCSYWVCDRAELAD